MKRNKKFFKVLVVLLAIQAAIPAYACAYDRKKAVDYARTWAGAKRSPAYHDYSSAGGDCTNYVSQCLYAGGHAMVSKGNKASDPTKSWWFKWSETSAHNPGVASTSWIRARDLKTFLVTWKRAKMVNSRYDTNGSVPAVVPNMSTGDVFFYDWQHDNVIDHASMLVWKDKTDTVKNVKGDLIDQHSVDHKDAIWHLRQYNRDYKTTYIWAYRVQ